MSGTLCRGLGLSVAFCAPSSRTSPSLQSGWSVWTWPLATSKWKQSKDELALSAVTAPCLGVRCLRGQALARRAAAKGSAKAKAKAKAKTQAKAKPQKAKTATSGDISAQDALRQLEEAGDGADSELYQAAITALAYEEDWGRAVSVYEKAMEADAELDLATYKAAVRAASHTEHWMQALTMLGKLNDKFDDEHATIAYDSIDAALKKRARQNIGTTVHKKLEEKGLDLNDMALEVAISVSEGNQPWEPSVKLATKLRESGIDHFLATTAAMRACGEHGMWEQALGLLRESRFGKELPRKEYYDAAIRAVGHSMERWAEAVAILEGMRSEGMDPDANTYHAAVAAARKGKQWSMASLLLEEMVNKDVKPNSACVETAVLACLDADLPDEALGLLKQADKRDVEMNSWGCLQVFRECRRKKIKVPGSELANHLARLAGLGEDGRPIPPVGEDGMPLMTKSAMEFRFAILPPRPTLSPSAIAQIGGGFGKKGSRVPKGAQYAKELRLLQHVVETAKRGDPESVTEAIESFGNVVLGNSGLWLKIAGGQKSAVLRAAIRAGPPGGHVLEIGTYCGYSSCRLAHMMKGIRVITLEVDPVHMVVARNVIQHAGLELRVDVWTGHSKDILPRLADRYYEDDVPLTLSSVFMDQKGSRYEDDVDLMNKHGLIQPGTVIVGDNVLKPGAPLYLWWCANSQHSMQICRVGEFAMPSEDWVAVSTMRRPTARPGVAALEPKAPEDLQTLNWEADRIRARARRPMRGVTYEEWADFADDMSARMRNVGIVATSEPPPIEDENPWAV